MSDAATVLDKEIVSAVRVILLELYRLVDLGVDPRRIDRIQRETLFFLYEGGEAAKWAWERPHSAAAREMHRLARERGRTFKSGSYPITYEHCIPLSTIRDGLKVASRGVAELTEFLDAYIAGVVVTRREDELLRTARLHRSMPAGAEPRDRLARYRAVGIHFDDEDLARLMAWPGRPSE